MCNKNTDTEDVYRASVETQWLSVVSKCLSTLTAADMNSELEKK